MEKDIFDYVPDCEFAEIEKTKEVQGVGWEWKMNIRL